MDKQEKVRENRLRRLADRQGLRLEKSRGRTPRAADYGTYHLVDPYTNTIVVCGLQSGYGLDLDEVEKALTEVDDELVEEAVGQVLAERVAAGELVEVEPGVYQKIGTG